MLERDAILKIAKILKISGNCFRSDACHYNNYLFNIDGYSASESLLPWMDLKDWGWKAVIAAFSDIAASGGRPLVSLYSVGVTEAEEGIEIAEGIAEASKWLGVEVLGGDFNRCKNDRWIDVVAIGKSGNFWTRWNTAREGLNVIQVGYLGFGAITSLLLKKLINIPEVPEEIINYTKRPRPPIKVLAEAINTCGAKAAIDNSDGWAWSLSLVAKNSEVGVEINELIVPDEIIMILRKHQGQENMVKLILNSAEDYNYALFADKHETECLLSYLEKKRVPAGIVGKTIGREKGSILFSGKRIEPLAWDSFA